MSSNWISPLEMCAAGGVLDYDAAADLLDLPQRFAGHPQIAEIPAMHRPLLLPPNPKINGVLSQDCYGSPSNLEKNPSWKKWLFGALVAVGALALLFGKKGKSGKVKMPDFSKAGEAVKNFGSKVWNAVKKPFEYIAGKLKK